MTFSMLNQDLICVGTLENFWSKEGFPDNATAICKFALRMLAMRRYFQTYEEQIPHLYLQ